MDDMNAPGDEDLIKAIRRRLLAEIEKQGGGGQVDRIVNNVYGSPGMAGKEQGGGVFDQLQGAQGGEDPFEYYVDISRRNVQDPNDAEKTIGWDKAVKRYKKKRTGMTP